MSVHKLLAIKNREVKNEFVLSPGSDNEVEYFRFQWHEEQKSYCLQLNAAGVECYRRGEVYTVDKQTEIVPERTYQMREGNFICRQGHDGEDTTRLVLYCSQEKYLPLTNLTPGKAKSIYLCIDPQANQLVVLKLKSETSIHSERFKRSARLLSNVSPYIPRILDMGEITWRQQSYQFQCFEYFNGQSIEQQFPLDQKDAAIIFQQIAMAVQDLHRAGLVHRNLTPEHILVDEHYQVKIVGLTLLKKQGVAVNVELTLAGTSDNDNVELSMAGEIIGDVLFAPLAIADPQQKDIYAIATLFIYSLQLDSQHRENFRKLVTASQAPSQKEIGDYLRKVPTRLKELLNKILIARDYVTAAELARAFAQAYSYIYEDISSADQYPMPKVITIPGAQVAVWYSPLEELGGDFYDCLAIDGDRYGLLVGDTMGHGMKACLYAHLIYPIARLFAVQKLDPVEILAKMDQLLYNSGRARNRSAFATALYGMLNLDDYNPYFRFANAGHPPPIIYRKGHKWAPSQAFHLKLDNTPFVGTKLGMGPSYFRTIEYHIQLQAQDILVFYTDGIIEAQNPQGQSYQERLSETLCKIADAETDLDNILVGLRHDLEIFCQGRAIEDDITLIAIKING